jgi:hypothetical protein
MAEMSVPESALEELSSEAFALRPHDSTSNVPLFCSRSGVVAPERERAAGREEGVELEEPHERVVGPLDGAVLVGVPERREVIHDALLDAARVGLLRRAAALGVDGAEEEDLVLCHRAAESEAALDLPLVELLRGGAVGVLGGRADGVVLIVGVERALHVVRAGLRDDVHEARGRAAELGGRAVGDDHDLLHGVEVERERRGVLALRCSPKNGLLKSAPSTEMLFWMPWPLMEISSCRALTTATLGAGESRKLRPLMGMTLTTFLDARRALGGSSRPRVGRGDQEPDCTVARKRA